jgi:hypothetical protein
MNDICTHLDTIQVTSRPESVPGCEDCLRIGGSFVFRVDLAEAGT